MAKKLLLTKAQNYGHDLVTHSKEKFPKPAKVRIYEANFSGQVTAKEGAINGLALVEIGVEFEDTAVLTLIAAPLNTELEFEDVRSLSLRIEGHYPNDSSWTVGAHCVYEEL